MKVFISWSGEPSKKLGEAFRDWLPAVLQLVTPYFTPEDTEKGVQWPTAIATELESSQVGILCVTRANVHSDWILFEAGALFKSLDKSNVCPILFDISATDLAGPLRQFQATLFNKPEMHKLIGVINNRLGDKKLPARTLDSVFNKWWPDLESNINQILQIQEAPQEPIRGDRELIEEILELVRSAARKDVRSTLASRDIGELLECFISLHSFHFRGDCLRQNALDAIKRMRRPLNSLIKRSGYQDAQLEDLIANYSQLSYEIVDKSPFDDDVPF